MFNCVVDSAGVKMARVPVALSVGLYRRSRRSWSANSISLATVADIEWKYSSSIATGLMVDGLRLLTSIAQ